MNSALRGDISYTRDRIHGRADGCTSLVQRPGVVNESRFRLLDGKHLHQSRPRGPRRTPYVGRPHDSPPRDNRLHVGIHEVGVLWWDTVCEDCTRELFGVIRDGLRRSPTGVNQEVVYTKPVAEVWHELVTEWVSMQHYSVPELYMLAHEAGYKPNPACTGVPHRGVPWQPPQPPLNRVPKYVCPNWQRGRRSGHRACVHPPTFFDGQRWSRG